MASYDIVIRNGQVADGTGKKLFAADVALKGDRIAAVVVVPRRWAASRRRYRRWRAKRRDERRVRGGGRRGFVLARGVPRRARLKFF